MYPKFNETHVKITEQDAIDRFHPERLKCGEVTKISKSQFTQTRWQMRLPNTVLCVILSRRYEDLCWWNGENWTYITTLLR